MSYVKGLSSLLGYIFLLSFLSASFIPTACKKSENEIVDKNVIGTTPREYADSSRSNWIGTGPRPLRVIIWYPCDRGGTKETIEENKDITLLKNGSLSEKNTKYPLIIISHGAGQKALQMFWLGSYLAMHGYITAAVNHNGTAEEEMKKGSQTLSDFCFWERPRDLSAVLNFILKDHFFAGKIDTQKIGAAGFSLGGASVIMAAGARLNLDSLKENSPPPPPQIKNEIERFIELSKTDSIVKSSVGSSANSFEDKRIKAVFALAPAVGGGFTKAGLSEVHIPVRIAVGDKDLITPAETNAKRYSQYIPNAELITLPGEAGHFIVEKSESKQKEILENVSELALKFFNDLLKK